MSKGENGHYVLTLTDSDGNKHEVKVDSIPTTIKDKDGNVYEVKESTEDKKVIVEKLEEVKIQNNMTGNPFYLLLGTDTVNVTNRDKITLVRTNENFSIQLKRTDNKPIDLDSIFWTINFDNKIDSLHKKDIVNIRATDSVLVSVFNKKLVHITDSLQVSDSICVKKICDLKLHFKDSPLSILELRSGYNGEFGFDDGGIFTNELTPPKSIAGMYDTIRVTTGEHLYKSFITLAANQGVSLKLKLKKTIAEDVITIESSNPQISAVFSSIDSLITIQNNGFLSVDFNDQAMVDIYRTDRFSIQYKMKIGQLQIISMDAINIDVQPIYFISDTTRMQTKVGVDSLSMNQNILSNRLNGHSYNQTFYNFRINNQPWVIYDNLDSLTRQDKLLTYDAIQAKAEARGANVSVGIRPNTIYAVMTELIFPDALPNTYAGGGVKGGNNFAVMWFVPGGSVTPIDEIIAHEIGHTLRLRDTFQDGSIGTPLHGSTGDNYMDYFIVRRRFLKHQIRTMIKLR